MFERFFVRSSADHCQPNQRRRKKRGSAQRFQRPRLSVEALEDRSLLSGGIVEYQIPTVNSGPRDIVAGPDGNLWFTEHLARKIGALTTEGAFLGEWGTAGAADSGPQDITVGADGNLWYTVSGSHKFVGRITTSGVVGEYPTSCSPWGISPGPDNNVWITMHGPGCAGVGRVNVIDAPIGQVTDWNLNPGSQPIGIVDGGDEKMWFAEYGANKLGAIQAVGPMIGEMTEVTVPTPASGPTFIATRKDGTLFFTEQTADQIGRFETGAATFTEFPVPGDVRDAYGIAIGPDNNVWFAEEAANKIGRFDPLSQTFREFVIPQGNSHPYEVAAGPDGNLWFVEYAGNKIGKLYVLSVTGGSLTATTGQRLGGMIAHFHDNEPGRVLTDYSVRVNWGDGTTSRARVRGGTGGNWGVAGSHVYTAPGSYDVTVTVIDTHPGGMTSTATSTVLVTDPPAPGTGGKNMSAVAELLRLDRDRPSSFAAAVETRVGAVLPTHDGEFRPGSLKDLGATAGRGATVLRAPAAGTLDPLDPAVLDVAWQLPPM
jgi:virginiamycin B lyase